MGQASTAEFILRAKIDEKTLNKVASTFNKKATQISDEFDEKFANLKIDKNLGDAFDDAFAAIYGKFQKLDLSSIKENFVSSFINTEDAKEQERLIKQFVETINLLKGATNGYSLKIFENLDSSKIEKLIDLQDRVKHGFTGSSADLSNFIKPLLAQLKTAQQMYDKIKNMSLDDISTRLTSLNYQSTFDKTGEIDLDNKQLREFIVLYEHAQKLLSQGLDLKLENADQLQKLFNAAFERYQKNGSTWIDDFNSIKFADQIQSEVPETVVPVRVVPDVSTFKQETEDAINALNVTGKVALTPIKDEKFDQTSKSLTKDDTIHGKLYLNPALAKNFKSTAKTLIDNANLNGKVTLTPKLANTFVSDVKKTIESKEIKPNLNVSPKITTDAKKSISSDIDKSLKNTESISSKLETAITSSNTINQSVKEAKESTEQTINAVKEAFRQVNKLKNSLKGISDFNNLSSLTKFFESIQIKDGLGTQLSTLADDLNKFIQALSPIDVDSAATLEVVLETIKKSGLTEKQINNFKELPAVIEQVYKAINNSSLSMSDNNVKSFLDYLTEILQKSKELQNLVTILNKTKTEDLKNSGLAGGTEDAEALSRVLALYKDLTQKEKERVSAKGEELDLINTSIEINSGIATELNKQVQVSSILTDAEKERARLAQENYDIQKAASDIKVKANTDKASADEKKKSKAKKQAEIFNEILSDASIEWKRVIDVASGKTDWFGDAIEDGQNLLDMLGRIVKIVKTVSTDTEGNTRSLKYTLTGETGNTQTIDATKDVQSYKEAVIDATAALNLYNQTKDKVDSIKDDSVDYSASYLELVKTLEAANEELNEFIKGHTEEGSNIIKKITQDEADEYANLTKKIESANNALSKGWKGSTQKERDNLLTSINNWEKNNSRGASLYSNEIKAIKDTLSSLGVNANVDELNNAFTKITDSIHNAGLEGQSFGDILSGQLTSKVASFVATFLSIQDIIRYVQQAISVIEDLDYALLDLSKTAAMTQDQLNDFYYSANESAQALGVATEEIINLASGWSRLGYNTNESATQLAELTAKFAAISPGMTTDEAQSGMTSIMKAWSDRINAENMEAEVLDKINVLGNSFALENNDIISGMQQCAAALSVMGTSYEDAFALFTGAQEIMQDADKVGNGLKSVAMRIRGYSEDVETGEYVIDDSLKNISGDLIELTKVAGDPILQNGISIYTDDTKYLDDAQKKYKSLVEYLGELADNWDRFSETTQTQLLQKLFAKTQASTGGALIENFEQVRAALEAMSNSAGSADAEMEKVEETITFKLNKLKEVWVGFLQSAASKELIKTIIDGLTSISELIIGILKTPVLREAVIGGLLVAITKNFKSASNSATVFFNILKSILGTANKFNKQPISASVFEILSKMSGSTADTVKETAEAVESTGNAIANVSKNASGSGSVIQSLSTAFSGLITTVGAGKLALMGIAGAVTAIGVAVIAYKKKQEQAIEDLNESVTSAFNTYKDAADTARTTTNTISGLEKEYATLSKGVNDLGQNVSLSSDEFDRYNEISNQIAELIPELVDHWTDEGNAVLTCKNNVEELTAAYKELSVAAASALINGTDGEGGADDIVANFQNTMNGVDTFWVKKSGLKDQQAEIENAKKAIQELRDLSAELKQDSNLYDAEGNYLQNLNLLAESSDKYADYQARILGAIADIQNYGADFNVEVPTFNIADNSLETYLADLNAVEKSVVASGQEISSQMTEARSQVKQLAEAYLTIDKGNLSDDQINAVKTYINGLSDDVIDGLDSKTAVDTLVTQITTAMAADTKVSGAIIGLLSIDKESTVKSAQELASAYIAALDKALEEGRIKQDTYDNLLGGIDQWWQDEKVLNHNASKSIFGDLNSDALMSELSVVDTYTDQFTTEQANEWREWANTCGQTFTSAQAMIEAYEQSLVEATEDSGFNMTSFSSNVEEFQKINEAYQQVAENISKGKIGKEIASDITAVEDLRDSFEGIDVSKFTDFESFDQIEQVLTSGTATAEEAQAGWDALATAYWGAKLAAGDYTEETQALISTQLQANGVTKESADSFVQALTAEANAKQMVADTGKELTEMSAQEINAMLAEAEGSQLDAAALLKLYLAKLQANGATVLTADDIANIEALGSAADINTAKLLAFQKAKANSTALENAYNDPNVTDKEIARLQKSAKELYSEAIKEVQSAANEATGSYSGVDLKYQPSSSSGSGGGGSSDSSDKEDAWLKAYEKAYERLGELRDRDKIDEYEYLQYCRALYQKYFDSMNTSNNEWNAYVKLKKQYESLVKEKEKLAKQNEDASKTSVSPEIKEEQENLEKLNSEYEELQKQLEEAKEARKEALSDDWAGNINLNDRPTVGGLAMGQAGWNEASGVDSYSTVYTNTIGHDNPVDGSAWVVQFTPILPDGTVMDEQSCYDYIDKIIEGATSSEEVMARDKADKGILFGVFDSYQNADKQIVGIDWNSNINDAIDYYQTMAELRHEDQADIYEVEGGIVQQQQELQTEIAETSAKIQESVGDVGDTVKEATEGTGKSAEEVEEQIQAVQKKLAEAEKNMSDDTREYLEQLEEAEYNYLNGMKSLYESVFSYISGKLDDQTSKLEDAKSKASDALEKKKTAAVNALKAEKEAAVAAIEEQIKAIKKQQEAIQDQIDAYQDEIDAINDANDAREREITLQKALYDLDKLNSQRTNLVYSESKGMHYESDLSGIRDARESVQDAKDDIAIANLEKKIELLEEEKEKLDDLIDELEDQKDALEDYYDKLIDETETYWDNLIEESEAYYDALIEQLDKQKTKIEEIQDKYELAKMVAAIQDLTGVDTTNLWDGLTNGSEDAINQLSSLIDQLATGYNGIIATMESDNTHILDTFGSLSGIDLSSTVNYLDETSEAFDKLAACKFDVVKGGVESIRDAVSSLGEDSDVLSVLGQHIGEGVAQALEEAKTSAEEGSKEITESVGKGMTSSDAITSVEESGKKVAESAVNGVGKAVEGGELKESTDASGLKVSAAVGEGMTAEPAVAVLDEAGVKVVQTAATGVATAAEGSEETIVAGDAIVTGIINSMIDSLNGGAGIIGLQMFVDSFAAALQTAFSSLDTSNLLDLGQILGITSTEDVEGTGTGSLSSIFQQLLDDITELNNQFQTIDISNVILQFTNLKQAISDASAALGGDGAAMMSTGTEGGSTGTGESGTGTSGSQKSSNTGGSLTEAMQTFGDTANEVLGGGEEGEGGGEDEEGGSGVIGKFTTLRSKVEDVTAAIGLGDDEGGSGGKSSGTGSSSEDGGTLIEALQAEQEVAMNEETGLPKQVSMWQELYDNINKCIEAVHRLIDALTELEEFSLTVIFKGHSKAGGTAEASGSIGYASGSMYVAGSAYAKGTAGLEKDQRALVGESGTEMLIRGNQWQLIGQHGAEYKDLKAGDIIFSAAQTKELMKHGKLRSRGHTVGGNSYADGTPLNGMFDFAGKELSSSALNNISAQLTGILAPMTSSIDTINRNVADLAASVSNVSSVNQTSNITIGDIHVSGVQDTDSFAKAIKSYLPGKMMQELHK